MAFTSNTGGPMADINVTPLVDVMLVLLIIFMVTVPALSYPIQVDLPQPNRNPPPPGNPPEPIRIHIDAGGSVSWNGSPTPLSTLAAQFEVEAIFQSLLQAVGHLDPPRHAVRFHVRGRIHRVAPHIIK